MPNKDTTKSWFETGDYPTQAQFAQAFDWMRWKDELLTTADLSAELVAILNVVAAMAPVAVIIEGSFGSYVIPAGFAIHRIYGNVNSGFAILTATDSFGEVVFIDETRIDSGTTTAIDVTIVADTERTIFFNLETSEEALVTTLKIYLHKN